MKNKKVKKSKGSAYHDMMARVERENAAKLHAESEAAAAQNALTKTGRLTRSAKKLIAERKKPVGTCAVAPAVDKALASAAKELGAAARSESPMNQLRYRKRAEAARQQTIKESDGLLKRMEGMDRYYRRQDMNPKGKTLMEVFSDERSARTESAERRLRRTQNALRTPMAMFRYAILKAGMEADRAHDVSAAEIACVFAELAAKWARVATACCSSKKGFSARQGATTG